MHKPMNKPMIRDSKVKNKGLNLAFIALYLASTTLAYAEATPEVILSNTGQNTRTKASQGLRVPAAADTGTSPDSIEFMLGGSTLNGPQNEEPSSEEKTGDEKVLGLVSENCSKDGDAEYFDSICKRVYSNGSTSDVTTHGEVHGSELKIQSQTVDYDQSGHQTGRQTIREKIKFKYEENNGERLKEAHYVDVVTRPTDGKTTREFYIYKYDVKSRELIRSTWTKYEQINLTRYASLIYNVALEYDLDGNPLKGKAERWKDGKKIAQIFNWSRQTSGIAEFDADVWNQWQEKTENVFLTRLGKDGSSLAGASAASI